MAEETEQVTQDQHQVYLDEMFLNWANNEWLKTLKYPPKIEQTLFGSFSEVESDQIFRIFIELVSYHGLTPAYQVKYGFGNELNFTPWWKLATNHPVPIGEAKRKFDEVISHKEKNGFTMLDPQPSIWVPGGTVQ